MSVRFIDLHVCLVRDILKRYRMVNIFCIDTLLCVTICLFL